MYWASLDPCLLHVAREERIFSDVERWYGCLGVMNLHNGRRAIDAALRAYYPGQMPAVFGDNVGPLEEVRAYHHPATPGDPQHWHYVTLGLSELDAKRSTDNSISGWGFELTARVAVGRTDSGPPAWPIRALAQLAGYVYTMKSPLAEGHHMNLGIPVDQETSTFTGFAFRGDVELGTMDTPNGLVSFLQAVTITTDEAELLSRWSVSSFLDLLANRTPLLVIDPSRASLLADPRFAAMIEERASREGSAESTIMAETLTWQSPIWSRDKIRLSLAPASLARKTLPALLQTRTRNGQPFRVMSGGRTLLVSPGPESHWTAEGSTLQLTVSPAMVDELKAFFAADAPSLSSRVLAGFVLALVE
jgi:suppressor of fused